MVLILHKDRLPFGFEQPSILECTDEIDVPNHFPLWPDIHKLPWGQGVPHQAS